MSKNLIPGLYILQFGRDIKAKIITFVYSNIGMILSKSFKVEKYNSNYNYQHIAVHIKRTLSISFKMEKYNSNCDYLFKALKQVMT